MKSKTQGILQVICDLLSLLFCTMIQPWNVRCVEPSDREILSHSLVIHKGAQIPEIKIIKF